MAPSVDTIKQPHVSGNLKDEGGANLDITLGLSPSEKVVVTLVAQQNFDKDLNLYSPNTGTSGPNDWNAFLSASWYF